MEQQTEASEDDFVARVEGSLADDPSSVHERAVASEVADAPGIAESLEHGMDAGDPVGVHDHIVRLEGSDGHSLGVERSKLTPGFCPTPRRSCSPRTPRPGGRCSDRETHDDIFFTAPNRNNPAGTEADSTGAEAGDVSSVALRDPEPAERHPAAFVQRWSCPCWIGKLSPLPVFTDTPGSRNGFPRS